MKDKSGLFRFLVYFIVVILINIAGATLFFRMDLTSNKVYSLSKASKDVVSTLSEPLTVKVFFSANLPAPYNNIERYLHDLLEEYSVAGNRYFNYEFFSVSGDEIKESKQNQESADSYGVQPVQIQNIEQDELKFQKAYMGMALIHGDIIEALPTITSTEGLEYRITSAIKKMNNKISALLRLEEKISIRLFLSSSLTAVGPYMNITGLMSLPAEIEGLIKKLNNKNYGKLVFSHHDPSSKHADEKEAEHYSIMRLNWEAFQDRQGRMLPADKGFAGIVVEHGGTFQEIKVIEVFQLPLFGTQYQLADLEQLETTINKTVENIIDINEEIGYLTDHGTLSVGPDLSMFGQMPQQETITNFSTLISEEYSLKEVNLKMEGIPGGLSSMVIAGAKESFSEHELYQIDQFIMKGGSLAVFMDPFNETKPQGGNAMMAQFQQPVHVPLNTGLEKLMSHYGFNTRKSIVLDENSFKQRMPQSYGGGERPIYFAPVIKNELISKEVEFLQNIKGLVMLKSSPVEIDEEKIAEYGLKAIRLFSSSDRSWEMSGNINLNPVALNPPANKDSFRSIAMAYTLEGSFPSYFADKPVPVKNDTDGEEVKETPPEQEAGNTGMDMSAVTGSNVTIRKGKPARIFLIGTSGILGDNVIDEEGKTPNAQFVMNVIDYLNNREETAVMRSKTQRFNPVKTVSPATKTTVKTFNIAGLPVLVIIAGIIVWSRRSARKRNIRRIFG